MRIDDRSRCWARHRQRGIALRIPVPVKRRKRHWKRLSLCGVCEARLRLAVESRLSLKRIRSLPQRLLQRSPTRKRQLPAGQRSRLRGQSKREAGDWVDWLVRSGSKPGWPHELRRVSLIETRITVLLVLIRLLRKLPSPVSERRWLTGLRRRILRLRGKPTLSIGRAIRVRQRRLDHS